MTPALPSNFANAVAPFVPMGRQPVGQENEELRGTTFKPLEQSAASARGENFRSPDQRTGETDERWRLDRRGGERSRSDREGAEAGNRAATEEGGEPLTLSERGRSALAGEQSRSKGGGAEDSGERIARSNDTATAEREIGRSEQRREALEEREAVRELAARDRQVRQHERAHAALGGRYAGAPRYEYERGPDGVTYAVSGEVPIDTSKIPDDPEATLEKAQQIRRAAFAPAEPSQADRRVAAEAAQLEAEARAELRRERLESLEPSRQGDGEAGPAVESARQEREAREQSEREQDRDERVAALAEEQRRRNIGTYLELIELGGLAPDRQLDQRA